MVNIRPHIIGSRPARCCILGVWIRDDDGVRNTPWKFVHHRQHRRYRRRHDLARSSCASLGQEDDRARWRHCVAVRTACLGLQLLLRVAVNGPDTGTFAAFSAALASGRVSRGLTQSGAAIRCGECVPAQESDVVPLNSRPIAPRAVSSAGERFVHTEQVTGSIPVPPNRRSCSSA